MNEVCRLDGRKRSLLNFLVLLVVLLPVGRGTSLFVAIIH